jgi:periplasmic protein TonB
MAAAALLETRFARPVLYAATFTFTMFWSMHLLIVGGRYAAGDDQALATIDFVRLKKDSQLEERVRKKPPKPEPPKTPPPPKMKVETPPPDAVVTPFQMPKLNLPTNVSGGPFLGTFTGGDGSGYSELIPVMRISPQYPRQAQRDGISGYVVFELVINPDGTVRSARPVEAKPRGVFESAAMQTIMKWKFKPKIEDGKPVESKGRQKVDFNLEGSEK